MRSAKVFVTLKTETLHFSTLPTLTRLSINYLLHSAFHACFSAQHFYSVFLHFSPLFYASSYLARSEIVIPKSVSLKGFYMHWRAGDQRYLAHPPRCSPAPCRAQSLGYAGRARCGPAVLLASSASSVYPYRRWRSYRLTMETSLSRCTSLECCRLWKCEWIDSLENTAQFMKSSSTYKAFLKGIVLPKMKIC